MRRFATLAIVIAGAALLSCASQSSSRPGRFAVDESHPGYPAYRQYCASCHGVFADGQGPVNPVLEVPATDLTRLAARYGRPLPKPMLTEFVDGSRPVIAHGSREMPVWGHRLFEGVPPNPAKQAGQRGTIQLILDYLESLQRDG